MGVLPGTRHTTNTETELNQEVSKKSQFRTAKYQTQTECHIQKNDGINQATAMKAEQGKECKHINSEHRIDYRHTFSTKTKRITLSSR